MNDTEEIKAELLTAVAALGKLMDMIPAQSPAAAYLCIIAGNLSLAAVELDIKLDVG